MRKLFGVIGDPIAHSMSPLMHNSLFGFYEIDAVYLPFHIKHHNLEDAIKGFKAIGVQGFNVTVPHKTTVIPFLDRIDPLAKAIGAVNTVVNENGQLIGYNTDGTGFVRGLTDMSNSITEKKVLVVGAGGAARAIYFSMAEAGVAKMDVCNRTTTKAEELTESCPYPVQTDVLDLETAEQRIEEYDLIIQTTSIGLAPNIEESPLSLKKLKQGCIASDIIYNPLETAFLQAAASRGATIQKGIDMFVYQGALAFEKWTGIFPDPERMREIVLKQLGGSSC